MVVKQSDHDYLKWKTWDSIQFAAKDHILDAYYLAETKGLVSADCRILEIGFGNGEFLGWCERNKFECIGVENNPLLIGKAKQEGFTVFSKLNEVIDSFGPESFDLIVAFDVLEHLDKTELSNLFAQIHRLLKTKAIFLLRVPNGDSPFGRAYQYGDFSHKTVLCSENIHYLAQENCFSVRNLREPSLPKHGIGLFRLLRWQGAKMIRKIVGLTISYGYFSGSIKILSTNLVAVLKKKTQLNER